MSPVAHRKVGVASGLVVALAASSLTYFAVQSKGETVHEADLNDGGVWVSSTPASKFARLNKAAGQFDSGVKASVPAKSGVDVLQDGSAVVGLTKTNSQIVPLNPRTGRLDEQGAAPLPVQATATNLQVFVPQTADMRGGTIATVDPKTGQVKAQRVDSRQGVSGLEGLSASAKPLATVGPVAAMAVDVGGNVHAVSGETGKVVTLKALASGFAKPVTETIKLEAKAVDITAVGSRWVVYTPVDDQVFAQGLDEPASGGVSRDEGQLAYAALQQPGPEAQSVALQAAQSVTMIDLGGADDQGGIEIKEDLGADAPKPLISRPVRLGACVHAAWSTAAKAYYNVNCGKAEPVAAVTLDKPKPEQPKDGIALRTNRRLIVLNDLDTGDLWDLDSKPIKIDDWNSLVPPPTPEDKNPNKDPNVIDESTTPQPPKAVPDELKARPGRTSKLHVLDNDTDTSGAILSIDPGDVGAPSLGSVSVSVAADGQSVDVAIPDDPGGTAFTFTYQVNNGTGAPKSKATVTVTLAADTENSKPHLRPGPAKLANTTYPVMANGRLPVQVIGDWRDAESDTVTVDATAPGSSVDGLGRLVVQAGAKAGGQSVAYAVDDGHGESAPGKVLLAVLDKDSKFRAPATQPDVVRGVVGKPLQIEPLGNDIPGADPTEPEAKMRLATEVRSQGSLVVDTDLDTGVVTLTGSSAGTFELAYSAQVGQGVSAGRIRVDLVADPDPEAPPVAVPDAATLRDQTPVLTDVLANDYSPRADVLVTRSVSVASEDSWLRPSIYKGRWVRVEALEPATEGARPRTGKVSYTISDGTKTTTGEVAVVQKPAEDKSLPIVQDDEAIVRAQDSVTIQALDNDSMAEGIPLVLDPESVKVLNGGQTAFASGNVVRFVPEDRNPKVEQVKYIEYAVYPIGMRDKAQTGRVAVTVKPLPTTAQPNQPPTARSFSTSVVAGEPLTITVPTFGVDPDGDSVTVDGIVGEDGEAVDLTMGRVTSFGSSTIKYEAYPMSAGTEVLRYRIRDRWGEESTAFVRIGVVQPGDPQPPVAVEDEVRAAPGKTVTVDATQNDLIERGDVVRLEYKEPLNEAKELAKWKVDAENTQFSTQVQDPKAGVQHVTYGIDNGIFDPSRASITVVPVPKYINRPVAVDDVAKPKPGEETTLVDVLANDRDIDGPQSSLKVTDTLSPDGTVEGNQVRVKILDHPHTVPYVIADEDGATAMALIYVPTGNNGSPFVVSGALIEMDKDSTKSVKLADYVKSPRARVIGITAADSLSASPQEHLSVEAEGKDGLRLESSHGYVGPAAVMLEVSDQETLDQKDFRTAYVSIPVQIGPKVPLLRCPDYAVSITAAGRPRDIDIPTLCHAWVPPGMTLGDVAFEAAWDPESKGVELKQSGTGNREVSLKADKGAPSSTNGRVRIQARGSSQPPSHIKVRVVGLAGNAANASANDPNAVAGPPRLRPFSVTGLKAGSSRTISLRSYLDSPLESPKCNIDAASSATPGVSVTYRGCDLTVTAAENARGSGTVSVNVSDAPGRQAAGRGTVDILGRPGAPTSVVAVADRVNGATARVQWAPPAYDGGSPITHYVVTWRGPKSGEMRCTASPCTIGGLTNGADHWFRVTAVNAVGPSDPSAESNPAKPDTLPNPVTGVHMVKRGDRSLTIGWAKPAAKGSEIKQYIVRATDTSDGTSKQQTVAAPALQTVVGGLTNNHQQDVRVRAVNSLGAGPWGPAVRMQSAGTPPAVGAPTLTPRGPGAAQSSEALKVSWGAVSPNGPAMKSYSVYRRVGSGAWGLRTTVSPSTRSWTDTIPYDGQTYTYVVTATNGAGNQSAKANTASFRSVAPPVTPNAPNVTTSSANHAGSVRVYLKDSRGSGYTSLQWETNAGRNGSVACSCAENATKAFTAGSLGNASQRMRVRVSNGVNWSPWSSWSNAYQPYGATKTPTNLRASRSGDDITWSWGLPTNGRPINQVQVEGAINATYSSARTSVTASNKAPGTYRLRVRAHSAAGWSPWTGYVSESVPQPTPTIDNVTKGSNRVATSGSGSCLRSPGCPEVKFSVRDFPGGGGGWNLTVFTGSGSAGSGDQVYINGSGNGYSWAGWIVVANGNGPVSVQLCRSGTCYRSASVPW